MLSETVICAYRGVEWAQRGIREGKTDVADAMLDDVRKNLIAIGTAVAGLEAPSVKLPVGVRQAPANDQQPVLLLEDPLDDTIDPAIPEGSWLQVEAIDPLPQRRDGLTLLVFGAIFAAWAIGSIVVREGWR